MKVADALAWGWRQAGEVQRWRGGCAHIRACPGRELRAPGQEFPSPRKCSAGLVGARSCHLLAVGARGSHFLSLHLSHTRGNKNAHGGRIKCSACRSPAPGRTPEEGGHAVCMPGSQSHALSWVLVLAPSRRHGERGASF